MLRILFAVVALFCAGCATDARMAAARTPASLNATANASDGKLVEVYGYYQDEFENHAIWESREAMESGDIEKCLGVLVPSGWDTSGFHGTWVVVRGRFLTHVPDYRMVGRGGCNEHTLWLANRPVLARARP